MFCTDDLSRFSVQPKLERYSSCESYNNKNSVLSLQREHNAGTLGVTLDKQLSVIADVITTSPSCRVILHNIRRIWLFVTQW